MVVVADSSPLIGLLNIQSIDLLPQLFGKVLVPPAVNDELISPRRAEIVRSFFTAGVDWLEVRRPAHLETIAGLHEGETEAICLAKELAADLLLVDDRAAFHAALARHINVVGAVGVLERAAERGMIDLRDAFERLKRTDFWIAHSFLDERLQQFQKRASQD